MPTTESVSRLGEDPIVGRLACPVVSRYDLANKRNSPLIVRSLSSANENRTWTVEIRSGIYWWSGDEVNGNDFSKYFESNIKKIVDGRWSVPDFSTRVSGREIQISWSTPPVFGPYILNEQSFFRLGDTGIECAGLYVPSVDAERSLTLKPNSGYRGSRSGITLRSEVEKGDAPDLRLSRAADHGNSPWTRMSDQPVKCSTKINVPVFTLMSWNLTRAPTGDPEFRKAMTMLTPRGALLRSGAGYMGELVSSLIPRDHPGYNGKVLVRDFDLNEASSLLEKQGYKRISATGPRKGPDGRVLKLTIQSVGNRSLQLEKVLMDSFAAVGIELQFVGPEEKLANIDGQLGSIQVDWHLRNLTSIVHSGTTDRFPAWSVADDGLSSLLDKYSLSLTSEAPDFETLKEVHRKLFEIEPITVLLQHKICLEGRLADSKDIDPFNPDWFKKVL